jgi:uncharacterized membrane protein
VSDTPLKTSRFEFIDLLRGWSVFVMIETHVFNAILRPELKDQDPFKVLTFINGLVAPSFLFCAGMAMAVTLQRKWDVYANFERPLWRYLVRLLFILVVGYSLHLPFFSLTRLRALDDPQAWLPFYQADILQTIAVSLMVLTFLAVAMRTASRFLWMTAILSTLVVFAAPLVRNLDYSGFSVWIRPYLTTQFKSQFPLFPWLAFLSSGTLVGFWFTAMKARGKERAFVNQLTLVALASIAGALVVEALPITIYPNHNFWKASPEFFFLRLGLVALALVLLWHYEDSRTVSPRSVFTLFGKESLIVYVVHLLIVYGYTYEFSFIRYFGPRMNYAECALAFLALTAAMWALAYIWHRVKAWNATAGKIIQAVVLAAIVVEFIVKST